MGKTGKEKEKEAAKKKTKPQDKSPTQAEIQQLLVRDLDASRNDRRGNIGLGPLPDNYGTMIAR